MKELQTLQQNFYQALQTGCPSDWLLNLVNGDNVLSSQQRLSIYSNSSESALIKVLASTFSVCNKLVGEVFFNAMAKAYIKLTPNKSPNINNYGESFASFIADFTPAKALVYLADVAKLEYTWLLAYQGLDNKSSNLNSLTTINKNDYEKIIFRIIPNGSLLASAYPILKIWEVNQPNYQGDQTINLNEGCVKLLICRPTRTVTIELLSEDEWKLLTLIEEKMNFRKICEHLLTHDANINLISLLTQLIQRGWVTHFDL